MKVDHKMQPRYCHSRLTVFLLAVVVGIFGVSPVHAGRSEPGALTDCEGVWIAPTHCADKLFGADAEGLNITNEGINVWLTDRLEERGIPMVTEELAQINPKYAIVTFYPTRVSAEPAGLCDAFGIDIQVRRKGTLSSQPKREIWATIYTDGQTGFTTGGIDQLLSNVDTTWIALLDDFAAVWKQQHSDGK